MWAIILIASVFCTAIVVTLIYVIKNTGNVAEGLFHSSDGLYLMFLKYCFFPENEPSQNNCPLLANFEQIFFEPF